MSRVLFPLILLTSLTAQPYHPELKETGNRYTFVIVADPQLGRLPTGENGFTSDKVNYVAYREVIEELNAQAEDFAFAVYLGDLVGQGDNARQWTDFEAITRTCRVPPVLVHGNHDGRPPYSLFRRTQRALNGIDATYYSFDAGPWHFVVLPAEVNPGREEDALMAWLEADLERHRDRPTMVFLHHHLMPQGLTQLEFYTQYPRSQRFRMTEALTRWGQVRWAFNGHVHNGLQPAVKTALNFRGCTFITAPTIVRGRNFGEEYARFAEGLDTGGYYLVVHVDGEAVRLEGRLAGNPHRFPFPAIHRTFTDDLEPRWFHSIAETHLAPALRNGGFESGLDHWIVPYRYQADQDPGFVALTQAEVVAGGESALYLKVREKGQTWAADEIQEVLQVVEIPPGSTPVLRGRYRVKALEQEGGGFLRLHLLDGDAISMLYLLDWGGPGKDEVKHLPRSLHHTVTGEKEGFDILQREGKAGRALFFELPGAPGTWHTIELNLRHLFEANLEDSGKRRPFRGDRLVLSAGVWAGKTEGSRSEAYFDDLELSFEPGAPPSTINGRPMASESPFSTAFGFRK